MSTAVPSDSWFDDFRVGDVFKHARGKTVTEMDNVLITNLVINTAEGHYNEHKQSQMPVAEHLRHRVVFGGITVAMIVGLAAQDTAARAIAELGMDKIRLRQPVLHGDTLYAYSEVLEKTERDDRSGEVRFRHWGVNQHDAVVFEGERTLLLSRQPAAR